MGGSLPCPGLTSLPEARQYNPWLEVSEDDLQEVLGVKLLGSLPELRAAVAGRVVTHHQGVRGEAVAWTMDTIRF